MCTQLQPLYCSISKLCPQLSQPVQHNIREAECVTPGVIAILEAYENGSSERVLELHMQALEGMLSDRCQLR